MEASAIASMYANEDRHWWFVGRRRILNKIITSRINLPESAKILEAGCGTGGNFALLREFGSLQAFEYDQAAREFAGSRSAEPIKFGHLPDTVDYPDDEFDMIALFDVLEHLDNDVGSLESLRAKLSLNGSLCITVPALPWLWSDHDVVHHHKRRYTRKTLKIALESAGLRVDSIGYFNTLLFPLALLQRTITKLTGGGNTADKTPPALLNAVLVKIFGFEAKLLPAIRFPIGLSLYATASRAND